MGFFFFRILTNKQYNNILGMNITEHALERMAERRFTPEMLGKFQSSGYKIEEANSGRYKLIGCVDGVLWTIIVEADMYTIVTVRRSHGDEND